MWFSIDSVKNDQSLTVLSVLGGSLTHTLPLQNTLLLYFVPELCIQICSGARYWLGPFALNGVPEWESDTWSVWEDDPGEQAHPGTFWLLKRFSWCCSTLAKNFREKRFQNLKIAVVVKLQVINVCCCFKSDYVNELKIGEITPC